MTKRYLEIVRASEADLRQHGDTFEGAGWTKSEADAERRYRVMLDVVRPPHDVDVSLLDFGCGTSRLHEHIERRSLEGLRYAGLDISPEILAVARRKFPNTEYLCLDVLTHEGLLPTYDYVIVNGVLTWRGSMSFDEMTDYAEAVLERAWSMCRVGLAFNLISKHVDWEREDLFHVPFDRIATFVASKMGRAFQIRHDYGLFEYTVYVYRSAWTGAPSR